MGTTKLLEYTVYCLLYSAKFGKNTVENCQIFLETEWLQSPTFYV